MRKKINKIKKIFDGHQCDTKWMRDFALSAPTPFFFFFSLIQDQEEEEEE